jgi:GNT-I family
MKCVTMTAWRRPEHTRRALASLKACIGIEKYQIIFGLNPDAATVEEMRVIFRAVDFGKRVAVLEHAENVGCNRNKKWTLEAAFAVSDYVIQFDDDVILAPDTLQYFEWAEQFWHDETILSVTATGHHATGPAGQDHLVDRQAYFSCWAWATWGDRWREIKGPWPDAQNEPYWDQVLCHQTRGTRVELYPLVSRAVSRGLEGGMHCVACDFEYWAGSPNFAPIAGFELATGARRE